jgi:hypothetical protein
MHNELRYQATTCTISEKLSKAKNKNSASSHPIFFLVVFFLLLKTNKQKKQQRHAYGKGNDI